MKWFDVVIEPQSPEMQAVEVVGWLFETDVV